MRLSTTFIQSKMRTLADKLQLQLNQANKNKRTRWEAVYITWRLASSKGAICLVATHKNGLKITVTERKNTEELNE